MPGSLSITPDTPPSLSVTAMQNEIRRFTVHDLGGLGGSIFFTFLGTSTASFAYNASAATMQTRLEGLPDAQPGDFIVTEQGLSGDETIDVTIEFSGQYSGRNFAFTPPDDFNFSVAGLTGDSSVSMSTPQQGNGNQTQLTITTSSNPQL